MTPRPERGPGPARPGLAASTLLLVSLALTPGCGRGPERAAPATAPVEKTRSYTLKGVVRKVDAAEGIVTIAHEELPGFMGAMTMPFTPRDRSNLAEIQPGDEVEGPLEVTLSGDAVKDYDLKSLAVTRPAPRTLTLDFASGTATMAPRPAALKVGEPVPDFLVTTQEGRPLKLSDLRGKVVVLTFIYTRCPLPDFCPALDRKFGQLADRLGAVRSRAEAVRLVSISFDPEHDTPEVLRRHAEAQGARPPLWTFAVASHDELARVGTRLGLSYGPTEKEIIHTLSTAVIAPDGTLARLETGPPSRGWTPESVLDTIVRLIPAAR